MAQEYQQYEILEIVAGGPKQYSLKMQHKETKKIITVTKIRGITFDKRNENTLPHELFKNYVLSTFSTTTIPLKKVLFNYSRLGPDKFSNVLTRHSSKYYRPINTKGYIQHNTVYPFGFKK